MKVSIAMVTYNHEKYLAQALDSVLMQKVDFNYEILVGEDCSTDNTRNILMDYYLKYPDRIKPILHDKNVGPHANAAAVMAKCTGEYIALLEGDDYWTDPLKLQKQVDFLESHYDFVACGHNFFIKNERGYSARLKFGSKLELTDKLLVFHKKPLQEVYSTVDLINQSWFMQTATIVYRNIKGFELPSWFANCASGDMAFLLLLSLHGKVKYDDNPRSVYRLHPDGISAEYYGRNNVLKMVYLYQSFNIYTNYCYQEQLWMQILGEIKNLPEWCDPSTLSVKQAIKAFFMALKRSIKKRLKFRSK
ncbi:MAG: glycosyltransferase [Desulfuromonadales bacterium]